MIRLAAYAIIALIVLSGASAEDNENASDATTTTTENVVKITENIKDKTEEMITDPVIERSSHFPVHEPTYHGFWKKKFVWRPRWVKTWQEKKVYVAVWKRMWGPVKLDEWVPIPNPPPGWVKPIHGWVKHSHGVFVAQRYPH